MTVKWVNLEITQEDIVAQLKANGQAGDLTQVLEVASKILDNIRNHDVKRELIGRAIKDIGVINLANMAKPKLKSRPVTRDIERMGSYGEDFSLESRLSETLTPNQERTEE